MKEKLRACEQCAWDMEKTQGLWGCRAAIGAFQLNVLILVLCRFCFSIDSGRKLYFRPSFRPISLNWLVDQESAPVPKQTKTATMKVLYVLDVQQLHTFDELSISFVVSRAIIQVHMFLAEGLNIQDVKPINSVCLGNPWNHSAIWPVVLLWPFGLVGSFALSAVKDATFGGWEAWSVESRWDQGWCRVELYDLYTFSEQDRSDFDGFCIMYLWKCQTF